MNKFYYLQTEIQELFVVKERNGGGTDSIIAYVIGESNVKLIVDFLSVYSKAYVRI